MGLLHLTPDVNCPYLKKKKYVVLCLFPLMLHYCDLTSDAANVPGGLHAGNVDVELFHCKCHYRGTKPHPLCQNKGAEHTLP